jgi:hypothetical protein
MSKRNYQARYAFVAVHLVFLLSIAACASGQSKGEIIFDLPTQTPQPTITLTPSLTPQSTLTPSATNTFQPSDTPRASETPVLQTTPTLELETGCPNGCDAQKSGCDIKGNISQNSGEKIFHVPGGEYYEATNIHPEFGERWFCTEEEAINNGWRKSKK